MLTDYFSCYKLNNTSTTFHEEKNSPKLKDRHIFNVIKILGYSNIGVQKVLSILEKVSAYRTGSAFT